MRSADASDAGRYLKRITRPALAVAPRDYLAGVRAAIEANGMADAVADHDTPAIFDWLAWVSQFQGISDDRACCENLLCPVFSECDRRAASGTASAKALARSLHCT